MAEDRPQRGSSVYTTAAQFYDRKRASLEIGFWNRNIYVKMAPIFTNMVGKTPAKGEKMYDYENNIFFYVPATQLNQVVKQIEAFEAGEIAEIIIETDDKVLAISCPGVYDGIDGRSISLSRKDNGQSIVFALEEQGFLLGTTYDEAGAEQEVRGTSCVEYDFIVELFQMYGKFIGFGIVDHGVKMAGGASGAPRPAGPAASSPGVTRARGTGRIGNGTVPSGRAAAPPRTAEEGDTFDDEFNEPSTPDDDIPY